MEFMSFPPLLGPTAPENNPVIEPEWFQPSLFPILAISSGIITTITTGTSFGISNNYVIGQLVRFNIPKAYGAQQLNGRQGYVIGIPASNQVVVNIDTSLNFDAFIPSPVYGPTSPQIVAIGDVNTGVMNYGRSNNGTTIPGAFINISPSAGG